MLVIKVDGPPDDLGEQLDGYAADWLEGRGVGFGCGVWR
jgi:hypothetical protein